MKWYSGIPMNPTLKTALLLTVTVSVFAGVGYLGYTQVKKIVVRRKFDKDVKDTLDVVNKEEAKQGFNNVKNK